jgi:hypothetical protein
VGRIEDLVAQTGGAAELIGPRTAWEAAAVVTQRFSTDGAATRSQPLLHVVNWLRLRFLTRAITNRDRTAVIGVGGARPGPLVVAALLGAWLAPRLPKPALVAAVGLAAATALGRGRLARLVWITWVLHRDAPGAVLIGEFAAREPGAGIGFATEVLDTIGSQVTLALTVQGPPDDRKARSLIRLYERRLRFAVVARHQIGDACVVLMVRAPSEGPTRVRATA